MKIILGTAQFGARYGISNLSGQTSVNQVHDILDVAKSHNINMLDTAISYGNSEETLGLLGINGWNVISKIPTLAFDSISILDQVDNLVFNSLERLKVNSIYGVLLHNPYQLLEKEGVLIYEALRKLKDQGIVKKIGVSIYSPIILDSLILNYDFDIVQAPFNPFDRRILTSGWLSKLENLGVELHLRSIFLQGLLLMKLGSRPAYFNRWQYLWENWESWLRANGFTALEACIRYVKSCTSASPVIGIQDAHQLYEVIKLSKKSPILVPNEFSTEDLDLLHPSSWPYELS